MAVDIEFIKSIPYFDGLGQDELDSIAKLAFVKNVERGEMVIYEGDPAGTLYTVFSGAVKIFKTSSEGKEQILRIARPGDSFNDVPVFDDGPNPASVQAMGPVVLYEMRKSDVRELFENHPKIAANTIRVLARQVRGLVSLVEDLSFRHVIGRVARILLQHTGDGESDADGPRLTQQDMAAMAGTAREVVGRSLKTLEDEGIIRLDRNRVIITDKEALAEMVEAAF
jgi:CRP-like cAMP-binding protein